MSTSETWISVEATKYLQLLAAERELAAELLKRQQAEHEKDCILEDLVRAVKLLEASKILKYYVQGVARCNGLSESATAYSKAVDIFLAGDPAALL